MSPPAPASAADRHLWQIAAVRDLFWIALAAFVVWFGYRLRAIFTPVLIALVLAYLVHPLVTRFERDFGVRRPLTIAAILVLVLAGGAALFAALGPEVVRQTTTLARKLPAYVDTIAARNEVDLGDWRERLNAWAAALQDDPELVLADNVRTLFSGTSQAMSVVGDVVGTTTYVLLTIFLIPIYFFFFAWGFGPMLRSLRLYIPRTRRARTLEILGKMNQTVSVFFRSRLLIGLIMGVLLVVGWALAGVPYYFLLGMAGGLLSLVPYLSVVVWPLAILLKWLDATAPATAGFDFWPVFFWPSFVYVLVQAIEGWVLTPWIQSQSLHLSAVTILLVVFIGGALGGLYGLILCIPIAACGKILLDEVFSPRLRAWAERN